jgi:hypothetical protein
VARKRSHKQNRKLHAMRDTRGYAKKGGALGNAGILGNTSGPATGEASFTEERELTGTHGLTAEKKKGVINRSTGSMTRDKGEREEHLL